MYIVYFTLCTRYFCRSEVILLYAAVAKFVGRNNPSFFPLKKIFHIHICNVLDFLASPLLW